MSWFFEIDRAQQGGSSAPHVTGWFCSNGGAWPEWGLSSSCHIGSLLPITVEPPPLFCLLLSLFLLKIRHAVLWNVASPVCIAIILSQAIIPEQLAQELLDSSLCPTFSFNLKEMLFPNSLLEKQSSSKSLSCDTPFDQIMPEATGCCLGMYQCLRAAFRIESASVSPASVNLYLTSNLRQAWLLSDSWILCDRDGLNPRLFPRMWCSVFLGSLHVFSEYWDINRLF